MLNFIAIPTDFQASVGSQATDIISDMSPVAYLIIGVFLGLFILTWLINMFRKND